MQEWQEAFLWGLALGAYITAMGKFIWFVCTGEDL